MRYAEQVKGKQFPVQAYSVSPLHADSGGGVWGLVGIVNQQERDVAARRRRPKRASIIVDSHQQVKSGAKMKSLVGRQHELEQVLCLL